MAQRFVTPLSTVQYWVQRAGRQRLDRVDWTDHRQQPRAAPNRTPAPVEARIVRLRADLQQSILGEAGAAAIHAALAPDREVPPSIRTIGRILARHGQVEVDLFDYIEMLKLAHGPLFDVLTGVAWHGGYPAAWVLPQATTTATLPCLQAHWQALGCPAYAQLDNDARFQGAHQHADVFGRVTRFCLQLGITPVFVPPREFGLQNPVESCNALWQTKVWRRHTFTSLAEVQQASTAYLAARRVRLAARITNAPARQPWPQDWAWQPAVLSAGMVIYIRRTSEAGTMTLLGHTWRVHRHWCHRLVRAEVDLRNEVIRCFALRRRAPEEQPLLTELRYQYPRGDLVR